MKTFFRCLVILSSLLFINQPTNLLFGCYEGGEDESNISYYFDPQIINTESFEPLLYTYHTYYTDEWLNDSSQVYDNAKEWVAFCDGVPADSDVISVIYTTKNTEMLNSICNYVNYDSIPINNLPARHYRGMSQWKNHINKDLENNSLVKYWKSQKNTLKVKSMMEYLLYAKSCEPLVTGYYDWDDQASKKRLSSTARIRDSLINLGLLRYGTDLPSVIKLRYAYQVIRLNHYGDNFQQTIHLYDSLVPPLEANKESVIAYWALGNKAGATLSLGDEAEASYLFSVLFDKCEDRRHTAVMGFRVKNDSVFQLCLKKCRSDHERATLYFLEGLGFRSNALEEMEKLYSLEPSSEQLEVLLVREIVKIEDELRPSDWKGDRNNFHEINAYALKLHEFITKCVSENKVRTPDAWLIAMGYSNYLAGLVSDARRTYAEIKPKIKDQNLFANLSVLDLAAQVDELQSMTPEVENDLFKTIEERHHTILLQSFVKKAGELYHKQGNSIKEFLCKFNISTVSNKPTLSMLDSLLLIARNPKITNFETFLVSAERNDLNNDYTFHWMRSNPVDYLQEIKATVYLSQHRFKEAIQIYEQLPDEYLEVLRTDPFKIHIRDCRDCDFSAKPETTYTRLTLAKKLQELEDQTKVNSKQASKYHFLLGNAYYNMTYFGNSTEAIAYERNSDAWDYTGGPDTLYVDCSQALEHYKKAMELSNQDGDMEFAAECAFMAAKCEQNEYYTSKPKNPKLEDLNYRNYFRVLMKDYSKTQYYVEAQKECEYFRYFVEHHEGSTIKR